MDESGFTSLSTYQARLPTKGNDGTPLNINPDSEQT